MAVQQHYLNERAGALQNCEVNIDVGKAEVSYLRTRAKEAEGGADVRDLPEGLAAIMQGDDGSRTRKL